MPLWKRLLLTRAFFWTDCNLYVLHHGQWVTYYDAQKGQVELISTTETVVDTSQRRIPVSSFGES